MTGPRERGPRLLPAERIIERWREGGGTREGALAASREQVLGLQRVVRSNEAWPALVRLMQRTGGDSWLAGDWPEGFEPLLLCAPLCKLVDFECSRCHVGQKQDGRSCVNPDSAFGRVGELLKASDRAGLDAYLGELAERLGDGPDGVLSRQRSTKGSTK